MLPQITTSRIIQTIDDLNPNGSQPNDTPVDNMEN